MSDNTPNLTKKKSYSMRTLMNREKVTFEKEVQHLRKDYSNRNRFKQMKHLEKSKSKRQLDKIDNLKKMGNFLQPTKIISLTASRWVIFDFYTGKYVRGFRAHDKYQLSVFSKLLIFCTINTLIIKHKIDIARFQVITTKNALKWRKCTTVPKITQQDILSLQDALYLMLMQEGQEYQMIIALNIGAYLQKKQKKQYYSVYDANDKLFKQHLEYFYDLVNSYCKFLKLENIRYIQYDPKQKQQKNICTAYDIAMLSIQCLKIPLFMEILKKIQHTATVSFINEGGHLQNKKIVVRNKTIQNPFISYFNVCRNWDQHQFMSSHCSVFYQDLQNRPIVIVALGSYSPIDREKDIQQIVEWYLKNSVKKVEAQELNKKMKTQILETMVNKKALLPLDYGISRKNNNSKLQKTTKKMKMFTQVSIDQ